MERPIVVIVVALYVQTVKNVILADVQMHANNVIQLDILVI